MSLALLNNAATVTWALGGGTTGFVADLAGYPDKTIVVGGTFGGATVTVTGSNDGVTFVPLNNLAGSAISFTTAGVDVIREATRFVRVTSAGGTGSAITAVIQASR